MALMRAGITDKEIVQVRKYLDSLKSDASENSTALTAKRLDSEYEKLARKLRVPVEVIHGHFPRKKS